MSECVHKILYLIMSIFSVVSVHLSMYVIHFCYRRSGAVGSKGQISHGTFQSSESDALRFVLGNDGKTLHLPYMVLTKSHKRRGAEWKTAQLQSLFSLSLYLSVCISLFLVRSIYITHLTRIWPENHWFRSQAAAGVQRSAKSGRLWGVVMEIFVV